MEDNELIPASDKVLEPEVQGVWVELPAHPLDQLSLSFADICGLAHIGRQGRELGCHLRFKLLHLGSHEQSRDAQELKLVDVHLLMRQGDIDVRQGKVVRLPSEPNLTADALQVLKQLRPVQARDAASFLRRVKFAKVNLPVSLHLNGVPDVDLLIKHGFLVSKEGLLLLGYACGNLRQVLRFGLHELEGVSEVFCGVLGPGRVVLEGALENSQRVLGMESQGRHSLEAWVCEKRAAILTALAIKILGRDDDHLLL